MKTFEKYKNITGEVHIHLAILLNILFKQLAR